MQFDWRETLGNWNPQLARELRGRLTLRNVLLTVALAIAVQLGLRFIWQLNHAPNHTLGSPYCQSPQAEQLRTQDTLRVSLRQQHNDLQYELNHSEVVKRAPDYRQQLETQRAAIAQQQERLEQQRTRIAPDALCPGGINRALWWRDQAPELFVSLSIMSLAVLLVGGTHVLIADLGREEQRGTLSFIRLSPRSAASIMLGKLLGVPSLFYLGVALALPWQWQLGRLSDISGLTIATLDWLGLAACACCYSGALLFGFVSFKLRGLQAWLGSGAIAVWLWLTVIRVWDLDRDLSNLPLLHIVQPLVWGWHLLAVDRFGLAHLQQANRLEGYHSAANAAEKYHTSPLTNSGWYHLHLDQPSIAILLVAGLYAGLSLWFWHAIVRRFQQPQAPLWTRRQSYWGLLALQATNLGFFVTAERTDSFSLDEAMAVQLAIAAFLLFGLHFALSPTRATSIDWARYRHQQRDRAQPLWIDLIWGDRSPALVALWLHGAIVLGFSLPWLYAAIASHTNDPTMLRISVALVTGVMLIALSTLQLANLCARRRWLVICVTVFVTIGVPSSFAISLDSSIVLYTRPWLLSPLPWVGLGLVLVGLNATVVLWLRRLGQSQTRSLLATSGSGRPSLQPVGQPDRAEAEG